MISPSLVDTQLELLQGEAIMEVVGIIRGSRVEMVDHNATITFDANGLYRIRAGDAPTAAVFAGSLEVVLGSQRIKLGKGHQSLLTENLKSEKVDLTEDDDLYAWSSVRSQYEAAASYQAAMQVAASGQSLTGWYFYDLLDCWAWLPGGAFFSPFGWGFYPTWSVSGARVLKCTVLRGGHWATDRPKPVGGTYEDSRRHWVGLGSTRTVPIDPRHPPILGMVATSPQGEHEARAGVSFSSIMRSQRRDAASFTRGNSGHAGGTFQRGASRVENRGSGGAARMASNSGARSSGGSHGGGGGSMGGGGSHGGGGGGGTGGGSHGGGGGGQSSGGGGHK
jgi:hypothetical protein